MNSDLLAEIIAEGQNTIKNVKLVPREYHFEDNMNYVLVGLRRSGKSTLLFQRAQELVKNGAAWSQIVYLNFEDERLAGMQLQDCNNILVAANQLTNQEHYYFFDEIQNIDGWERFARRMADEHKRVYITGSNSRVLGTDIILRLGGRYMTKYISPFNFREYLKYLNVPHEPRDMYLVQNLGQVQKQAGEYLQFGGLPEAISLIDKRNYLTNIYQNVFLADIVVRNNIRNKNSMGLLIKKISETIMHEASYASLHKAVKAIIPTTSRNSIVDYVNYAEDAYLIFTVKNYFTKFVERESNPKYYFTDNGILNLFYIDKNAALLENLVAVVLFNKYADQFFYLKSAKTKIDVDFFVPETKTAIQVAWNVDEMSKDREIGNLVKLAKNFSEADKFIIVTKSQDETIIQDGVTIKLVPLYKFLLEN